MELKLREGRYCVSAAGGLETVGGSEETLQRALMRLAARRGSFRPDPDYGSRLYLLAKAKPAERAAAARLYAAEALAGEPEIDVESVDCLDCADGTVQVTVALSCGGTEAEVSVNI